MGKSLSRQMRESLNPYFLRLTPMSGSEVTAQRRLWSYRTEGFLDLSEAAGPLGGSVAMGAREMPGSGSTRRRLHFRSLQEPVHTATTDVSERRRPP